MGMLEQAFSTAAQVGLGLTDVDDEAPQPEFTREDILNKAIPRIAEAFDQSNQMGQPVQNPVSGVGLIGLRPQHQLAILKEARLEAEGAEQSRLKRQELVMRKTELEKGRQQELSLAKMRNKNAMEAAELDRTSREGMAKGRQDGALARLDDQQADDKLVREEELKLAQTEVTYKAVKGPNQGTYYQKFVGGVPEGKPELSIAGDARGRGGKGESEGLSYADAFKTAEYEVSQGIAEPNMLSARIAQLMSGGQSIGDLVKTFGTVGENIDPMRLRAIEKGADSVLDTVTDGSSTSTIQPKPAGPSPSGKSRAQKRLANIKKVNEPGARRGNNNHGRIDDTGNRFIQISTNTAEGGVAVFRKSGGKGKDRAIHTKSLQRMLALLGNSDYAAETLPEDVIRMTDFQELTGHQGGLYFKGKAGI